MRRARAIARVVFLVAEDKQHSSRLVEVLVAQHNTTHANYKKS